MQNNNITTAGKNTLLLAATVVLILALLFKEFYFFSTFVTVPIVLIWLPFVFSSYSSLSKNEADFVIVSFAYLILFFIYSFVGYSHVNDLEIVRNIMTIMCGIIPLFVLKLFNSRELGRLFVIIISAMTLLMYIYIVIGNRLIVSDDDASTATVAWQGSMFMLVTGISTIFFIHVKSFWPRVVSLMVIAISIYVNLFVLQRGTIILLLAVEITLIIFFGLKNKALIWFLSVFFVIMAIFVYVSGSLISFFDWLSNVIPSERLASRFRSIEYALIYEDIEAGGSSLAGRSHLMGISWNTFTSSVAHFVFGAGEQLGSNTIIGHHSFMIDTLARYGIIGGAIIFVYFKKQYKNIMSNVNKKTDWTLYCQCAVVFFVCLFRNYYGDMFVSNVNLVLMLLLPLTIRIIQNYKINKKVSL